MAVKNIDNSSGSGVYRPHEGTGRLMMFFTGFVAIMGLTFVSQLRDYHRTDHGGGGRSNAVHLSQPSFPAADSKIAAGAEQMVEHLQRQAEQIAAETAMLLVPKGLSGAAEAKPEAKPEVKPEAEPEAKPEVKPEAKPEDPPKPAEQKKPRRLNVALFYADDWTMKVLGKLDKNVKTPNIDRMADNGMIFTNNCVTTSVCWSSRSTLATGTYSAVHKHTFPFQEADFETEHWTETLYPLMKRRERGNYYTGLFGKWHKLEKENELNEAFDESIRYYGSHWEERNGKMRHVTELNAADSLWFLDKWDSRRRQVPATPEEGDDLTKPFFLTTSFFATHARDGEFPSYQPLNATREIEYPDSVIIPKPKTATKKHWNDLPHFLRHDGNEGRTRWKKRFDPESFQANIKDIYAMATDVDAAIGTIVDKITQLGVLGETVLIFTTDNGNMHGEHGLAEKWYPFEESLRVPLVIQDPRMPKERRGTISEAWTLNVDLTPTILGVANLPPSDFMQGRDISDLYLYKDEDKEKALSNTEVADKVAWRKDWFYEFNLGMKDDASDHPWTNFIDASFALVTDEWKYVVWPQHDDYEQLFHRSVDPFDEWDLLNKVLRGKNEEVEVEGNGDTVNGPFKDTVQTTRKMYEEMKQRYAELKKKAQAGERI